MCERLTGDGGGRFVSGRWHAVRHDSVAGVVSAGCDRSDGAGRPRGRRGRRGRRVATGQSRAGQLLRSVDALVMGGAGRQVP